MENCIRNPLLPYVGPIYAERFNPGQVVRIQGIVASTAYRFDIDLQCGPQIAPRDDIAVQLSFRFLDQYVAVNSLQSDIWGEEQRGALPIKRAEHFEIILVCEFNQYKVVVNGRYYCTFPQRIHYDRISHLVIEGDVSILQISYTESPFGDGFSGSSTTFQGNDFETTQTPSAPPGGSSPPSYEAAVQAPYPIDPFSRSPERQTAPYPTTGSPSPRPMSLGSYPAAANSDLGFSPVPIGFFASFELTDGSALPPYPLGNPLPRSSSSPPYPLSNPHPRSSTPPYPLTNPHPRSTTPSPPYPQTDSRLTDSPYSASTTIPLNVENSPTSSTVPLNTDGSFFNRAPRSNVKQILIMVCIVIVFAGFLNVIIVTLLGGT